MKKEGCNIQYLSDICAFRNRGLGGLIFHMYLKKTVLRGVGELAGVPTSPSLPLGPVSDIHVI